MSQVASISEQDLRQTALPPMDDFLFVPESDVVETSSRPLSAFDHERLAGEAVERLRRLGIPLDFSLASLAGVDAFVSALAGRDGIASYDDHWTPTAEEEGHILVLGSYAGEVLRRKMGGRWRDDVNEDDPWLRAFLVLESGARVQPLRLVYERFRAGQESCEIALCELYGEAGGRESLRDGVNWARFGQLIRKAGDEETGRRLLAHALRLDPSLRTTRVPTPDVVAMTKSNGRRG